MVVGEDEGSGWVVVMVDLERSVAVMEAECSNRVTHTHTHL